MKNGSYLTYVPRIDIEENFESSVAKNLENEDYVLLGFAGVGKSASAKAIAATYVLDKKSAIYLKIDRTERSFQNKFEIIEISGKRIAIPTITIPFMSINQENLLSSIINALNSIYSDMKELSELARITTNLEEKKSLFEKMIKPLKNLLVNVPKNFDEAFGYLEIVSDAMPYVSLALNICKKINNYLNNKKLISEQQELLIIVDDLEDLNPNWLVLQKLLSFKFRYLFVIRVETPNEYLLLLKDKLYSTKFLEKIGIPFPIRNKISFPLVSLDVFKKIMTIHNIPSENIQEIWTHSGGIPAVGLMLWKSSGGKNLDKIIPKIIELCNNQSISHSWKSDDIETRISYTMYATKIIYEELKSKNYAYVALTVQPMGVSQDELVLFCGLMFGEICTDKNAKVYELLHLYDEFLHKKKKAVRIEDKPCVNSPCKFTLEPELVETFQTPWWYPRIKNGKLVHEDLPTVSPENSKPICYSFNSLFTHISPIITQFEKTDNELHRELEDARKTLFEIISAEVDLTTSPTGRLTYSAHNYLGIIDNFDGIEDSVTIWVFSILVNNLVLVYLYENFEKLLDKIIISASKKEINLARLIPGLCYLSRQPTDRFPRLSKTISDSILKLKNSSDRLVLLMIAHSLAIIAEPSHLNKEILNSVKVDSEYFLKNICKQNDPLCSYAKTLVYTASAESLFATANYSKALEVFQECDSIVKELKELTFNKQEKLSWLKELQITQDVEIINRSAHLNAVMGTLYFYLDDLDQAINRYDSAIREYNLIEKPEGVMIVSDGSPISQLMKNGDDEHMKKYLNTIAENDKGLTDEQTKSQFLSSLQPKRVSSIHVRSSAARLILNTIYDPNIKQFFDEMMVLDTDAIGFYHLLELIIKKYYLRSNPEFEPIFHELLFIIGQKHREDPWIVSLALMLSAMKRKNQPYVIIEGKKFPMEMAKKELIKALDKTHSLLSEQLCGDYREKDQFCIIESLAYLSLTTSLTTGVLVHLSIHLLYDKSELAEAFLNTVFEENPLSSKLLKRISRQLRLSIHKYYQNQSRDNAVAKDLILNYMRLWYFLHD